jgi:PKD repeat protein
MKKILLPVYTVLCSLTCFSQVNLSEGLMAYYPFNGNANDASSNNNNPLYNNASLTADRFGNPNSAYHFNGRNNYMRVRNSPSLNMANKISIAVWVKPTGYYTGTCYNNMLVMKGDNDYLPGNYSLRFSDAYTGCTDPKITKEMFYGSQTVANKPIVQLGQWYHVVWTCDGTTLKIYVDCALRASVPTGSINFTNSYDLFLGHMNNPQYPYWLNGDLDEVRIYNRALSGDEVLELCKKDASPENNEPAIDFAYTVSNCNMVKFEMTKAENIKNFSWDIAGKKTTDARTVTRPFKTEGNYVAKLIATGTNGKEITISKNITITKPTAAFSVERTAANTIVKFNIDDKQKLRYSWHFGDGGISAKEKNITHVYQTPGDYQVQLIAENKAGCRDTAQQLITIAAPSLRDTIIVPVTSNIPTTAATAIVLEERQNTLLREIVVSSDSLSITFYDNAEIDGDSVTIVYNNTIIATHLFLTDQAKTFKLPVDKTAAHNELVMYAENLGSIPPNTALMVVYDGDKRYEISISSSKTSNGMVSFIFKR